MRYATFFMLPFQNTVFCFLCKCPQFSEDARESSKMSPGPNETDSGGTEEVARTY